MKNVCRLLTQYGTPRNMQVLYVLLTLVALAVAGGAPAIGGGSGGHGGAPAF